MEWGFCHLRLATGGGIASEDDAEALVRAGITHVINARVEPDFPLVAHKDIAVLWNPTIDDGLPKDACWFGKSIGFALGALATPKHRVYAHCSAGSNRGPSTALAILLAQGFTFDEALALVLKARPQAQVAYRADALRAVKEIGYL